MRFVTLEIFKTLPPNTVYQEVELQADISGSSWYRVKGALQSKHGLWHESYILPGYVQDLHLMEKPEDDYLRKPLEEHIIRADVDADYYLVYEPDDIKFIISQLTEALT